MEKWRQKILWKALLLTETVPLLLIRFLNITDSFQQLQPVGFFLIYTQEFSTCSGLIVVWHKASQLVSRFYHNQ